MKIHLIRHGTTMANLTYTYTGQRDIPLCDVGIKDLKEKLLTSKYPDINGLGVYTSGMKRAEETLEILYGNVPHTIDRDFMEMNFGEFEGRTYEELKDEPDYQAWLSGDHIKNRCPGGESGEDVIARALRGMDRIIEKSRDAIVVCHGGVITHLFGAYFPDSGMDWYEIHPSGGEGYTIEFENGKPVSYVKIPTINT